jgi:hypothetical protein
MRPPSLAVDCARLAASHGLAGHRGQLNSSTHPSRSPPRQWKTRVLSWWKRRLLANSTTTHRCKGVLVFTPETCTGTSCTVIPFGVASQRSGLSADRRRCRLCRSRCHPKWCYLRRIGAPSGTARKRYPRRVRSSCGRGTAHGKIEIPTRSRCQHRFMG